jgi:hypothetical protein
MAKAGETQLLTSGLLQGPPISFMQKSRDQCGFFTDMTS